MRFSSTFVFSLIVLFSFNSSEGSQNSIQSIDIKTRMAWVAPNEHHPIIGYSIHKQSNHGVYVSVGTERSFMGAAVTGATALYVIDLDPDVAHFVQINKALLAASTCIEDYRNLRLAATAADWKLRAPGQNVADQKILEDANEWEYWNTYVRNNYEWESGFQKLATESIQPTDPFFGYNYLFDKQLYQVVFGLAKNQKIFTKILDFKDEGAVRSVFQEIHNKGWSVGVVDTSNVHDYVENSGTANYTKWIIDYVQPNTQFMSTHVYWDYGAWTCWHYLGYSGAIISQMDVSDLTNRITQWDNLLDHSPDLRGVSNDQEMDRYHFTCPQDR